MRSMTGFGNGSCESGVNRYNWEVRSVNHRFLQTRTHLPREFNWSERGVQETVAKYCKRGSVDVRLNVEQRAEQPRTVRVDENLLAAFLEVFRNLKEKSGQEQELDLNLLLNNRDLVRVDDIPLDEDEEWKCMEEGLASALQGLRDSREAEGQRLAQDMRERLSGIEEQIGRVRPEAEKMKAEYGQRLQEHVEHLQRQLSGNAVDKGRLEQEMIVFCERSDITEELVRLASHIDFFRGLTEPQEEPVGRKLDFLLQEMNREINTLGSKCSSSGIAQLVVEMKSLLEQIREQVQNIE